MKILRKRNKAIGWKIFEIHGISLDFMHAHDI